jgi:hypothetical protein
MAHDTQLSGILNDFFLPCGDIGGVQAGGVDPITPLGRISSLQEGVTTRTTWLYVITQPFVC